MRIRVDVLFLVERDHHPLRMQRIVFSGELLGQIWIALPVRLQSPSSRREISVELCAAIAREATVAQRVAVGVPDHFAGRSRIPGEVSFARGIAPRAFRIPMPRLHKQVCVLPVADGSPSRRENFLDLIGTKEHVGGVAGHAIDGRSQGIKRAELVHHVAGRRVDRHGLRGGMTGTL